MIARTDWSVNELSVELAVDRRTLARKLSGLEPANCSVSGKRTSRGYRLAEVITHLAGADGDLDLNHERAVLTKLQQEKIRLELAELRGELIRGAIIEQHWQAMVCAMRARLLAIPSRCAPELAGPDRHLAVTETLQAAVYEVLTEISGDAFPAEVRKTLDEMNEAQS